MTLIINGRPHEVPTKDGFVDSDTLRTMAGIPSDRALIMTQRNGDNLLVNDGKPVPAFAGQHFADTALHESGM